MKQRDVMTKRTSDGQEEQRKIWRRSLINHVIEKEHERQALNETKITMVDFGLKFWLYVPTPHYKIRVILYKNERCYDVYACESVLVLLLILVCVYSYVSLF